MYRRLILAASAVLAFSGSTFAADSPSTQRLIASFDCTKDYPPQTYFALGDVKVTESAAGRYREAGDQAESRFGYRFNVEHIDKPHLAVVRYPDDKPRHMGIMDGTCYDLNTGVFTGRSVPVSGTMRQVRLLFWPRWKDCSIVLTNMKKEGGEPAAAANIEIFELDELSPLEMPAKPGDGPRRQLAMQFEDPCGVCGSEGAMTRREWLERVVTYARHSGQTMLVYPIVWYSGPWYPSEREPVSYFEWNTTARDRRQYIRWTTQPEDWVAETLKRFGESGLEFRGSITLLRLGSLMQKMNVDLEAIQAGQDTINNMLYNDLVQTGTQDWTTEYDVRNFAKLVEYRETGKSRETFPWAYGESRDGRQPWGAIFNPVHPQVQEAILGLVQEVVDRYDRYPAFKGIHFNVLWPSTFLCFGSLKAGYDDYTVNLFEKETGIAVPVNRKAPDRFSKRYAFLTGSHREQWIKWRCEKIRDLLRRIRDTVRCRRDDLSVTLNLRPTAAWLREAGVDVERLYNEPGIELAPVYESMSTSLDHLIPANIRANGPDAANVYCGAWLFNKWAEHWGKHTWFSCKPDDSQTRKLAVIMGKPAEGICRMNSGYPEDGFWWDSQLRIVPCFPGGDDFMKHYAETLAKLDARLITSGGLILDKAHDEPIRRFALAFAALPAEKFETVGDSIAPVAVRTKVHGDRRYCYLVNQSERPVNVQLQLDAATGHAVDLAVGRDVDAPGLWAIELGPYELRSFAFASSAKIVGFSTSPVAAEK